MEIKHSYPATPDQDDVAHELGTELVRCRPDLACLLCQAGRCWQEVTMIDGVEHVLHGEILH